MSEAMFSSIREAAIETGLSQYMIRIGCREGSIPHIRRGEKYYINMALFRRQLDGESLEQLRGEINGNR